MVDIVKAVYYLSYNVFTNLSKCLEIKYQVHVGFLHKMRKGIRSHKVLFLCVYVHCVLHSRYVCLCV